MYVTRGTHFFFPFNLPASFLLPVGLPTLPLPFPSPRRFSSSPSPLLSPPPPTSWLSPPLLRRHGSLEQHHGSVAQPHVPRRLALHAFRHRPLRTARVQAPLGKPAPKEDWHTRISRSFNCCRLPSPPCFPMSRTVLSNRRPPASPSLSSKITSFQFPSAFSPA